MEKPAGVYRTAVLGDSFMEGYSVSLEDSFHRRLEVHLQAHGQLIETLNFGVAGYGTLQEYLAFHEMAMDYSPDLVLLGFCLANDLRNNSQRLESLLGGTETKLISRPFLESASDSWRISDIDLDAARRRYDAAVKVRSSLWGHLYNRSSVLQLAGTAAARVLRTMVGGPDSEELELALYGVHYCEETPEYQHAWHVTRRILERLRDEIHASGATLVVFSVPDPREASRPYMQNIGRRSEHPDLLCLDQAPGYRRLESLLAELKISYIDLLPTFRLMGDDGGLFRKSDRHWNERGHALAAKVVGNELLARRLLPVPTGQDLKPSLVRP